MPNTVVGEIWYALTWLNQSKTFWVNNLVSTHSIKECSRVIEIQLRPRLHL